MTGGKIEELEVTYKVEQLRFQRDTLHSNLKNLQNSRDQEKDQLTKKVAYYKNLIGVLEAWNKEFEKENENQKTKIEQQKRDLDKALDVLEKAQDEPQTSEQSSDEIQTEWARRLAEKKPKSRRNVSLTATN